MGSKNGNVCAVDLVNGQIEVDAAVVCAGAWSQQSDGPGDPDLGVEHVCRQMLWYRQPPHGSMTRSGRRQPYLIAREDGVMLSDNAVGPFGMNPKSPNTALILLRNKAEYLIVGLATISANGQCQ